VVADDFDPVDTRFVVLSKQKYHEYLDVRLQALANAEMSEIVKMVMNRYEVVSFEEELPTMNEVFIQTVKETEPEKTTSYEYA
jgi:ABC-2 type transport system ATP-binding protein